MDQLTAFAQENWIIIAAVIVVILIVIKVVKSVIKWLVIAGLAVAVLIYGFNYTPEDIKEVGSKIIDVVELSKESAASLIMKNTSDATFEATEDGGFVVTADQFKLEGKEGAKEVTFTYLGKSITLNIDDNINNFIAAAKSASSGN